MKRHSHGCSHERGFGAPALLLVAAIFALWMVAPAAWAGEYHTGATLVCADCHVAHASQTHAYTSGGTWIGIGPAANGYGHLLRNEVNDLCLTCHNGGALGTGPDVFGANTGTNQDAKQGRTAGALNAAPGHLANDLGYDTPNGHTLWSSDVAPGGTFTHSASTGGLNCVDCHSQHGQTATQYRNLKGGTVTYAVVTNDSAATVYEKVAKAYGSSDVQYNEPDQTKSGYADWCKTCHTNFHSASGAGTAVGGASGGDAALAAPWTRHPQADVNIGWQPTRPYISSLTQFTSHTNKVKVMDQGHAWDGTSTTITPSCFSCHKSHGNKNAFGLIFMQGSGTTVNEEGDGGTLKDLCRQCHVQGA